MNDGYKSLSDLDPELIEKLYHQSLQNFGLVWDFEDELEYLLWENIENLQGGWND